MSNENPITPEIESLMKDYYAARGGNVVTAGKNLRDAALKILAGTPIDQVYDVGTRLEQRLQELGHNR